MTTWVLLAGLPATGKSTLAGALVSRLALAGLHAASLQAVVLDKDRVRVALFPGTLTDYTSEQDDLCARAILEAAAYLTERGRTRFIFFDGRTFSRHQQIEDVLRAAAHAGAEWKILHLTCSDEVAEGRLRMGDPLHPARNRDVALYRKMKHAAEPISFAKLDLDTTNGLDAAVEAALRYLTAPPSNMGS